MKPQICESVVELDFLTPPVCLTYNLTRRLLPMVARTRSLHPWRRRLKLLVFYREIIALLLLVVMLGAIGATFYSVARFLPSGADIGNYQPTEATKIISE
ncbi:MAG: hypothetical protein K6U00_14490, partial [Armatimonadetes bacterium]|nr:hypothetical protein [Armatimonadota bacterium]